MSLVSYAQNSEDIMLWRALKHIDNGFYVDVGANDPDHMSVTKLFYDRGWNGINIDPIPQWFKKLEVARPRDINLQVGASDENGELLIYEFSNTGLSTFDKVAAERNQSEHGFTYTTRTVATERLTDICAKLREGPIHFLKIDVEGAEELVLRGLDLKVIRPWIVLIESTLPLSQVESHLNWEHLLLAADYQCAYFDGLNRFYLATEHGELASAFRTPPNIFDGFRTHETVALEWQAAESRHQLAALETENSRLEDHIASQFVELNQLKQERDSLQRLIASQQDTIHAAQLELANIQTELSSKNAAFIEYQNLLRSRSWKITAPLRFLSKLFNRNDS